ncbi:hypothetical protein ACQPZF_23220 [Actinosynnema sp. CS-041913]|uniref:hypothetical protein n=1 Tax=Actinosynnema sp. CS-041913 TaxID=3239917 RepID=UPI003D922AA8
MSFLDGLLARLLEVKVDALPTIADRLAREATALTDNGANVHRTWQGLASCYRAPEAATLFAATQPIMDFTASLGADVVTVSAELAAYTAAVVPLQAEARALIERANAIVPSFTPTSGEGVGAEDSSAAEREAVRAEAAALMSRFMEVERICANGIRKVANGAPLVAGNGDGVPQPLEYGATPAEIIDQWGGPAWQQTPAFGVAKAAGEWLEGWWDLFTDGGETAKGVGLFAASVLLGGINEHVDLPGMPKGTAQEVLGNVLKGTVAWDEWSTNPGSALGQSIFNVGTLLTGVGRIGPLGKAASVAAGGADLAISGTAYDKAHPPGTHPAGPLPGFGTPPPALPRPEPPPVPNTPVNVPEWDKQDPAERALIQAQTREIRDQVRGRLDQYADEAWDYTSNHWEELKGKYATLLGEKPQMLAGRKGTEAHSRFKAIVEARMNELITPDSGYRIRPETKWDANGNEQAANTGAVVPDLLLERQTADGGWEAVHTWDLKTQGARIKPKWSNEVIDRLDPVFTPETVKAGWDEDNLKPEVEPNPRAVSR